ADQAAMRQGNARTYMRLIQKQLLQRFGLHPPLAQPFCDSQIKQRIAMLKTPDSSAKKRLRYAWAVAAALLLTGLLACEKVPQKMAAVVPAGKIAVTGRVTDESGKPIEGVTIVLKGTSKGAAADRDGQYVLLLDEMPQNRATLDATLKPGTQTLDRIYIFGYTNDPVEPLVSATEIEKKEALKEKPAVNPPSEYSDVPPGAFVAVEQMPEFPGGMAELMRYLARNIRYPASARKEKPTRRSTWQRK
nr:carboxypeptidase-like regulatory domain-containing protein [Cytophagales bacterium]